MDHRKNIFKKILVFLKIGLITFLLLETGIMLLARYGDLNIYFPTYSFQGSHTFLSVRSNLHGYQHVPNESYQAERKCYESHYKFNSLGFRDGEAEKHFPSDRVIVLGDSYMEGYAVDEDERLSDLLEKKTKIPHLNFGMSDKGMTQTAIIYDSIASKFDHTGVLISFFPANDFIDDDIELAKMSQSNNIRPYLIGEFPNYRVVIYPKDAPQQKSKPAFWKTILKNFTYTYNAAVLVKRYIKGRPYNKLKLFKIITETGMFHYSDEQFDRLKYSLLKIKEKAEDRSVTLICIPSVEEIHESEDKYKESIEVELAEFCYSVDIKFIGLLQTFSQFGNQLYHECDCHWNSLGHKAAAQILLKEHHYLKN